MVRQVEQRGRLAPSPTGELHLGHARTFLLAYWHARSRGGHVVLRIEDVDAARASREHVEQLLSDLEWLGLEWEGNARLQSDRIEELRAVALGLLTRGLAYPCVCSRGDLRAQALAQGAGEEGIGAPQGQAREFRYPGTCRDRFDSIQQAEARTGRPAGLRLRTHGAHATFDDLLHGPKSASVEQSPGDFLILRRDKTPSYHLAVVVDDAFDGVADVVRGEDLLESTARQVLLGELLGTARVAYAHVPLVLDESGRRLAKRDQARSLRQLREQGVAAAAIVDWAAVSAGQNPLANGSGSNLPLDFDLRRMPKDGTVTPSTWTWPR